MVLTEAKWLAIFCATTDCCACAGSMGMPMKARAATTARPPTKVRRDNRQTFRILFKMAGSGVCHRNLLQFQSHVERKYGTFKAFAARIVISP